MNVRYDAAALAALVPAHAEHTDPAGRNATDVFVS
jgi:hypothetical protein